MQETLPHITHTHNKNQQNKKKITDVAPRQQ